MTLSVVTVYDTLLIQIVNFDQSDSGGIVYATYNRGVVTWWQRCDNRRLPWIARSMAAVPDIAHLVGCDDPADYRLHPIIIASD
jgi:hypothetical protein